MSALRCNWNGNGDLIHWLTFRYCNKACNDCTSCSLGSLDTFLSGDYESVES